MLKIGIPAGLQGLVFSISNILVQSSVNSLGTEAVAGNAAETNIESIVYLALVAIANSATTFVGQNYGAQKYKRIPKISFYCMALQFVFVIICSCIILPFRFALFNQFIPGEQLAIKFASEKLIIILSTYFIAGFMDTVAYTLRGMGITFSPFIIFSTSACGFRILWIFTIFAKYRTPNSLFIVYPLSWIVSLTLLSIEYAYIYKKRLKC